MLKMGKSRQDGRRGASLVEFTLVIFLLLLLVVGVADFARAFYTYNVLTNASREGARMASRRSDEASLILDATKAEAKAGGVVLADANIAIDPDPSVAPAEPGDPITVTVSHDVDTILGHIAGFDTVPLRAHTKMVVFWKQD
jgi:Flp pilus assembly protein TadG